MSRARAIVLVAQRELLERAKSRAFLIGLVITELLVVGAFVLPSVLGGDDALKLGYVGRPPEPVRQAFSAAATQLDHEVVLEAQPDRASGEAAVSDDRIEGLIVPPEIDPGPDGAGVFVVKDRATPQVLAIVQTAYAILGQVQLPPLPGVVSLEPQGDADAVAFLLANAGVVLLFVSIFTFGYWVLSGVVEEKQSRVVEVILSTVTPRDLLIGKVLGIGILGLAQLVLMVGSALGLAIATRRFELPPTTATAVALMLIWFVIGYTLYSTMFAVLGALASRMEEASNATTPVSLLATGVYLVGLLVVPNDPDGTIARIGTLFPPSAPMIVPLRAAFGAIEPWEAILAAVLALATIWGLFVVGGRVYSGAVLRIGGRVRLRDAWRASGE
ncbi:MAG TPA: ABC transporter permease [Candidatus Limnocylindrales bacterium]